MFSKELIFFDSEFSSLNPYEGELLSIGMVKENGEECYLELACEATPSDWVREHVLPMLMGEKLSREAARERIIAFLGSKEPLLVASVNQYDTLYFYKLFNGPETPFYWMPLDFASMLFAYGYDPEQMDALYQQLGIDHGKYRPHHALDDARLLRLTYHKLQEQRAQRYPR